MAAFSSNTIGLPNLANRTGLARSPHQHKLSFPCNNNFNRNTPTPTKTTSLARVNDVDQDHVLAEQKPSPTTSMTEERPVVMSPTELVLQLVKLTAERPVEYALDAIVGPSISQGPLRLLVAAVAAAVLLPGGSWEWWTVKAVVSGGLLTMSAGLFVFLAIFSVD